MVLRGILISAIITGVIGLLIVIFRERLVAGASQLGGTIGSIFTAPFTGFLDVFSTAFQDLPDIKIDVPGLIIGGGGITILDTDVGEIPGIIEEGLGGIGLGLTNLFQPFGGFLPGKLSVENVPGLFTRAEILEQFPGTVGLFDVLATKEIEFLPFTQAGIESAVGFGLELELSGQIFKDIKTVGDVLNI